jgi:lysophospholipase L1-like esterase
MALLVASLALVAVSAEVVVRAIGAGFRYGYPDGLFREDPDTGYSMVPSFGPARFIKHEFETTVSTNTAGFFDREHGPPQPGVVRLLSLGDSNVWGAYGIRRRENYSAQLVGELRSKFAAARFEVINAGVPGWGTDNELDFYRSRGFRYGAQIVLLSFTVANDFFDNRLTGEMAVRKGRLVRAESVRASRGVLGQVRNFFFSHSHFYRWAEIRLVQHPAISSWMRETGVRHGGFFSGGDAGLRELFSLNTQAGRQTQLAVETRKRLVELNEAARLHSARLVVFLVPAKFQVVASDIAAVQARFEVDLAALLAPQRYLRDLCAELDIPLIDSTEAIRRADAIEPQFWRLNPHFNRAGNRLAAEIIAKTLVEDPALREAAAAIPLKN